MIFRFRRALRFGDIIISILHFYFGSRCSSIAKSIFHTLWNTASEWSEILIIFLALILPYAISMGL